MISTPARLQPLAEKPCQNRRRIAHTRNTRKAGIALPVADDMANAPAEPAGQLQPLVDL